MTPARLLTTPRLQLTPLQWYDAPVFDRLLSDPAVRRYLGGPVAPRERRQRFRACLAPPPHIGLWVLRQHHQQAALGLVVLAPHHNGQDQEVSYQLAPRHWGNGYAFEAVSAVIHHALHDLHLPRVLAETQSANRASCRMLTRLGLCVLENFERFGAAQTLFATPFKGGT